MTSTPNPENTMTDAQRLTACLEASAATRSIIQVGSPRFNPQPGDVMTYLPVEGIYRTCTRRDGDVVYYQHSCHTTENSTTVGAWADGWNGTYAYSRPTAAE